MEMNKADEVALEESISAWKLKRCKISDDGSCPLCDLSRKRDRIMCSNCIIKVHTGLIQCHGTPYWPRHDDKISYYNNMITFMESLRPKKKVEKDVIEIGNEVTVHDYSWMYKLRRGTADASCFGGFNGMDNTIYTVVEVGVHLPEGGDNKGKFGNDTILFELASGNYVFTRERYLRLVKPKCCPKCGKAK